MATTDLADLPYPAGTDSPDVPRDLEALAKKADGQLFKFFDCTAGTRPWANGATGKPAGFGIYETDTTNGYVWNGAAWIVPANWATVVSAPGGGGGGGGGGTAPTISTVSATYAATAAQSIGSGADVVVAFGVVQVADSAVSRGTSGAGHSFTLTQTRLWTISATLRFAQNGTGGRTVELRAGSTVLAKVGADAPANTPYTGNLSVTRKFPAGTVITAIARHNAGTSLALEPNGGEYVHIDLAGI